MNGNVGSAGKHWVEGFGRSFGAIRVLRNADGGGWVSIFPEKSVTKV